MLYTDFKDFVTRIPDSGAILGIDWGAKRMGVAISDAAREFVFPRGIIESSNSGPRREQSSRWVVGKVQSAIESDKIVGIVIGLPTHADGTDSNTTRMVRVFANELAAAVDIPITFVDERLSSVEAETRNKEKGIRNKNAA
ncbi:MAG: Holliday junction resolvase RuvX, partial [Alphaproteobacteria bacterium]|nr:Holliday junction resolvase RuvX [Alphaproteobacteria bacterium]